MAAKTRARKLPEKAKSKAGLYLIPVRGITGNTNPRYPLSDAIKNLDYGIFERNGDLPSVWELATSDDLEKRKQFADLIREHDPEFVGWASTFITAGQLQPVEAREGGSGKFTLVFGCRRCLAILFNWCVLGKPAEPLVEAKLTKGNETDLMHRAVIENIRKNPNPIEEAKAFRNALNTNQSMEEIALSRGVSEQTIKNRLALLDLDIQKQRAIESGELKPTKALAQQKHHANGEQAGEQSSAEQAIPTFRRRSVKEIETATNEFAETTQLHKFGQWVLGRREDF